MAGQHRKIEKHPKVHVILRIAGNKITHIVTLVSLHAVALTVINHGGSFVGITH